MFVLYTARFSAVFGFSLFMSQDLIECPLND